MASLEIQHHYRPSSETRENLIKCETPYKIFSLCWSINNYISSKWLEVESHSEEDDTAVWTRKV